MTLDGLMTLNTVYAAAALLAVLLTVTSIRLVRRKKAAVSQVDRDAEILARIDTKLATAVERIEKHQDRLSARLHDDIRGLQSDMDWLAGERMIEEAISMARTGETAANISSELGLSKDAAETITRFRKH